MRIGKPIIGTWWIVGCGVTVQGGYQGRLDTMTITRKAGTVEPNKRSIFHNVCVYPTRTNALDSNNRTILLCLDFGLSPLQGSSLQNKCQFGIGIGSFRNVLFGNR